MTKVRYVKMGKSNGGEDGFFFFAEDGEQAMQTYIKNHDWTVGDIKFRQDEWDQQVSLFMPQDQELLELFREYIKLVKDDRKVHPEKYGTLSEPDYNNNANYEKPLSAEDKAKVEAFDAIAPILGDFWEITGSASFTNPITYDPSNYDYTPTKDYEINEARFVVVYGTKNFRTNFSPVGFSWMSLASYKKHSTSGELIEYTDFGTVQFYAPSFGFTWQFISKSEKENYYRTFEFPLSINFSPLFAPKSEEIKVKNEAYDSELVSYFDGFQYNVSATIGADAYLGDGFGIGVSAGGTYVNIKTTSEVLTETINDKQRKFTIVSDELNMIIPRFELKLILRY